MAGRIYVYVDGESHFLRSENAWRKLRGPTACLDRLRYLGEADNKLILVDSKAKVFWTRRMNPGVHRTYYYTSVSGDNTALHNARVTLRNFDLEPCVFHERAQLAKQRQHTLDTQNLIEKSKGVDIALAVRMIEDAVADAFEACHIYTSDIDFLPVVQAVRARGKQVFVHGYKDGLASESAFLHECDLFTDLEVMLREQCELAP
jgi:uncharacterized LabA/DUF88 family protein